MKRKFFAFIALITATLSLSSCLSSDETTVEYTHDTAITAFSLGSLDRYTKTKAGKDTLLKANVTGSDYKFYIDQARRWIYNVDSLPCGVRDTAILATISSKNSSPILLMDINKTDSVAAYYSSSDSINFSKPRFIRVYSGDYSAYAEYKVTVNVHKELPYEFKWHELAQNNSQLAAFSDLKAVACGDDIYVFGKTAEGTKVLKSAINDGSAWSSIVMNVSLSSDAYQSAVALDGKLYIADGGKVYASADAAIWTKVSENADIRQLIGASSKNLYAYNTAAGISVSKDKGVSWEQEKLDTDKAYLPKQNISMNVAGVLSAKDVENVMLLGTRDKALNDTVATTWLRTVDYANEDGQWNYLEIENNKSGKMPWLDQVITCAADTGFVALGSNGKWYKSQNAGLTWKQDKMVVLPAKFATEEGRFAFCRDNQHYYWIIRNGYVWRGRFNIDGWRSKED